MSDDSDFYDEESDTSEKHRPPDLDGMYEYCYDSEDDEGEETKTKPLSFQEANKDKLMELQLQLEKDY